MIRFFTPPPLICVFLMLIPGVATAQDSQSGLSFKRLFLDYQTLNGGSFGAFKDYTDGLEFSYLHRINDELLINVPVKIGMRNFGELPNLSVYGIDVHANYYLRDREKLLRPYVLAGVGAVVENKDSLHMQIPLGFGLDLRIAGNAYVTWQSELRLATKEDRHNFHHGVGFKYFFGGEKMIADVLPPELLLDTDGDGVPDHLDRCPTVPGLAIFDGCPDTDGDGIPDHEDDCPEVPGLAEFRGCPDTDGDGIPDNEDDCPYEPGPKENRGCPITIADRDGDGFPDDVDRCPDEWGTIDGCPDSDGDGVPDIDDLCPNTPGPAWNFGCPVIEEEDKETLAVAMRAVQFEHNSARLRPESHAILDQVVDIMNRYPDYRLEINGHTDSTGPDALNMRLSQNRAKACYDYLASRGVPLRRMSYVGFGKTRPIAENDSQAGRQLNRRVEFNLFPAR